MSEPKYYTVGPVDESAGRFVSRHNRQENIESGKFILTNDIADAFIWNTQRFASLYCSQGNFRIKPVEANTTVDEDETYVITALTFTNAGKSVNRDVSTIPLFRGHRLVESSYESEAEALYVRNILEREHPEIGVLTVVEYSSYQAAIALEQKQRHRRA